MSTLKIRPNIKGKEVKNSRKKTNQKTTWGLEKKRKVQMRRTRDSLSKGLKTKGRSNGNLRKKVTGGTSVEIREGGTKARDKIATDQGRK